MEIVLYNTLKARREAFVPIKRGCVTMYVCGPTVYNNVHIGNARPIVVFDTLYRLLSHHYKQVDYVRNITDLDDKIIQAAAAANRSVQSLTQHYSDAFYRDIEPLNVLKPSKEPRATEHINVMLDMIAVMLKKGCAYESQRHVLFKVSHRGAHYGRLSKRKLEDLIAGARVEVADYKHDPLDFVLWKPSSDQEPGWESPWGRGRPGWHLECSAMAKTYLGEVIDIHGGGQDLVFPHHENEIAQSCCVHDTDCFARYWVHNGYITVQGEKMAKSAGNFITLHEALQHHHGEVVRYALLNGHYRKPMDWNKSTLLQAKRNLDRWYRGLSEAPVDAETLVDTDFMNALADDLNTPAALRILHELARNNRWGALRAGGAYLGLLQESPQAWFKWTPPRQENTLDDYSIEQLLSEREQARRNKNYNEADKIRQQLEQAGIVVEDRADGAQWRRLS